MTQPGTPTAETWNKQTISTASLGCHTAPPELGGQPAKNDRNKGIQAPSFEDGFSPSSITAPSRSCKLWTAFSLSFTPRSRLKQTESLKIFG